MQGRVKRLVGALLAFLAVAGLLAVGGAALKPEAAVGILAGYVLLALLGTLAAFARLGRVVDRTLGEVDETIRALADGRQAPYFSLTEDSLLGKFQADIATLYDVLLAGKEREAAVRQELERTISHLVHQLNTPITNIRLYSGFLLEEDLTEAERRRFAGHIQAQAEKVSFLGEGFAKAARLEMGVMALKPEKQPVLPMVLAAIDQVSAKARAQDHTIVLLGDQHLEAYFDGKWTQEALFNVLDNAVKYSWPHTPITVEIKAYEFFIGLSVTNSGPAIAQEDYARIFSRFYRAEAVREQEGVGLGLYLSREILRSQGGYIKVGQTGEGGETVFTLYLSR